MFTPLIRVVDVDEALNKAGSSGAGLSLCRSASQVGCKTAAFHNDDTGSHERSCLGGQEYGRFFSFLKATQLAPWHANAQRSTCIATEDIGVQFGIAIATSRRVDTNFIACPFMRQRKTSFFHSANVA